MEMGFDEKEVIDALRVNNNQQDAAVCLHRKIQYNQIWEIHLCAVRDVTPTQTQMDVGETMWGTLVILSFTACNHLRVYPIDPLF